MSAVLWQLPCVLLLGDSMFGSKHFNLYVRAFYFQYLQFLLYKIINSGFKLAIWKGEGGQNKKIKGFF